MEAIVDKYRKVAQTLGLDVKSERTYVLDMIQKEEERMDKEKTLQLERADKALELERAEKTLELERADKARQLEQEQKLAQLELEKERLKLEAQERERDRTQQFELEKLRLLNEQKRYEVDNSTTRQESQTSLNDTRNQPIRWNVDMPFLDAAAETDVAAYLKRFEHLYESQNIPREYWHSALAAKFKGNSLKMYDMLSAEEVKDYDLLSQALLKRFLLTAEHFRQSFRSKKIEAGETYSLYLSKLTGYLARWIDLSGTESSFPGLRSLILKEQFLQQASPELATFLKEREFDSLTSLTHAADLYQEAHEKDTKHKPNQESNKKFQHQNANFNKSQNSDSNVNNKKFVPKGKNQDSSVTCTYCKKKGHMESQCYSKNGRPPFNQRVGAMSNTNSTQNFQLVTEIPQNCTPESSNQKQVEQITSQNKLLQVNDCNSIFQNRTSCCPSNFSCGQHNVNLACGCSAYDIRSACETGIAQKAEKLIPTARGEINGKMGRVLRDTGATCIVVKQSFVDKQQYTGEEELCIFIDGTTKRFPVAKIHLNTPYFHGTSKAVVMQNPLYDIIIGNVVNSNVDFNRAASSIQHKEPDKPICLEPVETQIKPVEINLSIPATFEEILITTPIFLQSSLIQELKQNPIPTQEVSTEIPEIISQTEPLDLRTFVTRGMQAKSQRPLPRLKTPSFPGFDLIVYEVKILHNPDKSFIKQVKYPILIPNQPVKEQILIPNQQVKEQIFICNRQVENTVLNSIQKVDNPISEIFNQQVEIPIPTFEEKSKIIETQVQAGPHDLHLVSTIDIQANFIKPIKVQKTEILP